jgi:hypothetical protein
MLKPLPNQQAQVFALEDCGQPGFDLASMRVDESFEGLRRLRQFHEIVTPVFDSIEVRHGAGPFLSPTPAGFVAQEGQNRL